MLSRTRNPSFTALSAFLLSAATAVAVVLAGSLPVHAGNHNHNVLPEFAPCAPDSDDSSELRDGVGNLIPGAPAPRLDFCSEWNPEFSYNGHHCCSKVLRARTGRRRRRGPPKTCARERFKPSFCDEVTDEEREYAEAINSGKIPDVLASINQDMGRKGDQAYCTVNNGFLAWGRPIVPTAGNRLQLRATDRCTNYGTDNMTGLVEWVGRQVGKEYSDPRFHGVKVTVGDVSAPRGGCLAGRNGPQGHASHTTGQDADIGFLTVRPYHESPSTFPTDFDGKANWWMIKQIFKNPYACVKVIFLDKKLIRKLSKVVHGDEDWDRYKRFIRHMPSHKNHMHVRVGDGPGQPGCFPGANPEDETEEVEGVDGSDGPVDLEAMDFLPSIKPKSVSTSSASGSISGQGADIQE